MTRTIKEPGANKALREKIKRIEAQLGDIRVRLDKLEVVRVPSPTVEPDPQGPQRPETE
jgi:hypothetical protein